MSLRDKFKTSANLERVGVPFEIDGTRILLARAGGSNVAYNNAVAKYMKDNQRAINLGAIDEAKALKTIMGIYAEHVVTEWETFVDGEWKAGIEAPDGASDLLPVTFENVLGTFIEMPDLFAACKMYSEDMQNYKQALLMSIVKN